jgi:formylglycine-generating enzyme required for sulfatase activity
VDTVAGRQARIDLPVPPNGAIALAWIPPGQAALGTASSAHPKIADEALHRAAFAHGFYLSRSEITRAAWQNVMGSLPPELHDAAGQEPDAPITYVSFHDAVAFCRRVSDRTGRRVRLPTEDEWEYAARAGMTGAYPDYVSAARHEWPLLPRYANFADRSSGLTVADRRYDDGAATLSAVGRYIGNDWSLADVIGNVWEWTADPYRHELEGQPSAPAGGLAADPLYVSTRGGSWRDDPLTFRFGNRNPLPADFRGDNVGFRIVVEGEAPAKPADLGDVVAPAGG